MVLTHLRNLNPEELIQFLAKHNLPKFRAAQILDWLHAKHVMTFSEMKNLGKPLQEQLSQVSQAGILELTEVVGATLSCKYLMKTWDGHLLESVLITQGGRRTVCVSTQLGCRMNCSFCASGKGRFGRNLTAGEIVEQVSVISRVIASDARSAERSNLEIASAPHGTLPRNDSTVTNVVFMGMGEPLDNYDATMRALEILTAPWGFGLGGRRITVSTSGIIPMVERFVHDSRGRVRLSVSLHSSNQETRSQLVPINKKYPLAELVQTLEKIHKELKREITFEYTLIKGINDSKAEALGVARIVSRLGAKVNLIPYNPIREMEYQSPAAEDVEVFRKLLESKHVQVTVRQTAGRAIDAACGQLRLDRLK